MITEVSIRCQKNPGGWYTPYTRVYPPIHHCTCISSSWLPSCWRWCIYCLYTSFCELETFAKLFVDFVQFLEGNTTLHGTHPTRPFHWTAEKMPLWMIPVVCGLPLCAVPQNCQFNSVSWNSSGFLIGPCKFHLCDLFTFTRWWLNTDVWSHRCAFPYWRSVCPVCLLM